MTLIKLGLLCAALVLITTMTACSSAQQRIKISPSDFDQDCATPTDCVGIYTGDSCCDACSNAAINKRDEVHYQGLAATNRAICDADGPINCAAIACAEPTITCINSVCGVSFP